MMRAANSNGNIVMIHNTILPHYLSIQDECSNCQYATLLKFFQYSAAISLFAIVPLFYIESGMKVKLQPLPVLVDFLPTFARAGTKGWRRHCILAVYKYNCVKDDILYLSLQLVKLSLLPYECT